MLQQARCRVWKKLSALSTLEEIQKRFFLVTTMMTQVQNPWIPFKGEKFQMPFLEHCLKKHRNELLNKQEDSFSKFFMFYCR